MTKDRPAPPVFSAPYAGADEDLAARLFVEAELTPDAEARIDGLATFLLEKIRAVPHRLGAIEDFLQEYSLSTEEGLALMVLAEALLRVPDDATADRLIEDKLAQPAWASHAATSEALLVQASAWALGLTARRFAKSDDPAKTSSSVVGALARRIGMGAVRHAARQAMQILGAHFILGRTIEDALHRAEHDRGRLFFRHARRRRAHGGGRGGLFRRLCACHRGAWRARRAARQPARHFDQAFGAPSALRGDLPPPRDDRTRAAAHQLVTSARAADIAVTIDAEEADRLELSLDVFEALCQEPDLAGWDGFGLAVQAYQKRAEAVLDYVFALAHHYDRRLSVRLVKGAYWDTEIKRAQERGLADYPVFSRKAMTDLNYLVCAQKLLDARGKIFPQFATHNALTVASVIARAGGSGGYEFQRLHGMGAELYRALHEAHPEIPLPDLCARRHLSRSSRLSRAAAFGEWRQFLFRRAKARDPAISVQTLLRRPQALIGTPLAARAPNLPLPLDIHAPERKLAPAWNSARAARSKNCLAAIAAANRPGTAAPLIDGNGHEDTARAVPSPIDGACIGQVIEAKPQSSRLGDGAAAARAFAPGRERRSRRALPVSMRWPIFSNEKRRAF